MINKKSQKLDVWNTDTGVARQDRSTSLPVAPAAPLAQPSKPQIQQLADGTWKVIKDAPGKVGTKLTQIWDSTKKNLVKQWESQAQPVMATVNYKQIIREGAIKKVLHSNVMGLIKDALYNNDNIKVLSANSTSDGADVEIVYNKDNQRYLVHVAPHGEEIVEDNPEDFFEGTPPEDQP